MFDLSGVSEPVSTVLDARVLDAVRDQLTRAIESPSGLDDAGKVDAIGALEKLGCVVSAAQAQLSVELDTWRREERAAQGIPAAQRGRGVAHEVARARRESPHRGQRHLGLAKVMGELPATWRAWRDGRITEWTATLIARETACLSREDRLAVDASVAGDADRLERTGLPQLVGEIQAEACRRDPASGVARRRRAEADRHVTLRPAPDTMTWLTALLPGKQGVAAFAALTRAADSARAAADSRSKGQVMTDLDLFGTGDEPAHLEGYGPIPAELAREVVAGACTKREQTWLRRLYCHPRTGELVSADANARRFRGSMARFIRLRDRVCRTPWCNAPVRHLDHPVPRGAEGPTSTTNAQGLCEASNYAKQAPGWRARPSPDPDGHEIETTLPTGHRYRSRPPRIVASIRHTPVLIDYVVAV
jgi:hypothetical protein